MPYQNSCTAVNVGNCRRRCAFSRLRLFIQRPPGTMQPTLARRQLGGLVPPKIATPSILVSPHFIHLTPKLVHTLMPKQIKKSAGTGEGLGSLVKFYSKLPKGPAPASAVRGIKARYFTGKNASAAPIVWVMAGLFGLGYTIDYQSAFLPIFLLSYTCPHPHVSS